MERDVLKLSNVKMTKEQSERFRKFVVGDDMDFYENFTIFLDDELQEKFFEENPEFMSEFALNRDKISILRDEAYRNILRKIKEYEEGKKNGVS